MTEEIIRDGISMLSEYQKENERLCQVIKRLEQEKFALTQESQQKSQTICDLKQENKELRQQYNCYACDTCNGKEDYRNMKRHCENAIKTVHKYRSVLEEIRDINKLFFERKYGYPEELIKIDDIISEVLQ